MWVDNVSKFAVVLKGSLVPCFDGSLLCGEIPKINALLVGIDIGFPAQVAFMERDAATVGLTIRKYATVLHILISRALSKILYPVVECVVVAVISKFAFLQPKNDALHMRSTVAPLGVKRFRIFIPDSAPEPLHQVGVVASVNDCDLPLRERNDLVGWVERLNNRRAVAAWLGHDLTSNEIAVFSRIAIVA